MAFAHQLLSDDFARAACEMLIGMGGVDGAYRELVSMLAAADDDTWPMYLEIMGALDTIRVGQADIVAA